MNKDKYTFIHIKPLFFSCKIPTYIELAFTVTVTMTISALSMQSVLSLVDAHSVKLNYVHYITIAMKKQLKLE